MTVLVYVHGAGRPDEFRWSLRSVAEHTAPGSVEVIVAGHIPDWLDTGAAVAVRSPQRPRRAMVNVWAALGAACNVLGPGTDFVYMHDDYFATAAPDLARRVNAGPAAQHIDLMRASPAMTPFRARLSRTVNFLRVRGITGAASWETHTPLPLNTSDVFAAGRAMKSVNFTPGVVAQRTLIAELAGHTGEAIADVKIRGAALTGPVPAPWVSTGTAAWHGELGDWLRARLAVPSPWELDAPEADAPAGPPLRPRRPTAPARGGA